MQQMFSIIQFAKEFGTKAKRIVLIGSSDSGKTFFGNALTTLIIQYSRIPVLVVDTKREKKFERLKMLSESWMNSDKAHKVKIQNIAVNGTIYRNYLMAEFAAAVCWTKQACLLYIEEAVELITKSSTAFPQMHPLVYKCLQQGREINISTIVATQRPAQLNLSFVDESTDIFIFQMGSRELKDIENSFRLPKESLDFANKSEHSFYHIHKGVDPIWYPAIKMKKTEEEVNL